MPYDPAPLLRLAAFLAAHNARVAALRDIAPRATRQD